MTILVALSAMQAKGDFSGQFLLFPDLVGDLGDTVFLEPPLDNVDRYHVAFF
jgi:hypothetical protein